MDRTVLTLPVLILSATLSLAAEKRNVLLIIADDLGRQVGCFGDPVAKTPNIDSLAQSGTRFPFGFASVASCSPSRATLLTGMPTHQCGQYGLAHATHNQHSFNSVKGLPALLAPAGYRSGVVAKLHVQPKEVFPFEATISDGGRNPVAVAQKARQFIEGADDKPFFLLVGFTDPHRAAKGFANTGKYPKDVPAVKFDPSSVPVPYHLPDQPEVRAELAEYYESVTRMDYGVGLLLKLLDERNRSEDTLVIFLSDNGIPFPGAKTTLYDAGVHLPLIIRKPGQKPGLSTTAMASWTDIAPTILDWVGVKQPAALTGRSLLPVLEQESPSGWDVVFGSHQFHEVTMYYPMRMIRTRTHKLIVNYAPGLEYPFASDLWGSSTWQGVLKRKDESMGQRLVKGFLHRPKLELYDLTRDPNELRNLAAEPGSAPLVADLRARLLVWQKSTADPWLVKEEHE